jgi:3-hydroxybutyrate dehydrogenase
MTSKRPLQQRVALITGSTSGIGKGLAEAFAQAGADIMLHGLGDRDEIESLRARLAAEYGVNVRHHPADSRSPDELKDLWQSTVRELGDVDILVNNAGVQHVAPIEEFPVERWTQIQDVVLNASFHLIRAAVPAMKRRRWGRIIQIVSAHGLVASPFKSAYVAAKHAQIGLTKTVALELAEFSVTCNAICPGYVFTPLVAAQIAQQAKSHGTTVDRVVDDIVLAAQPTKRFVEVEEIAALAVFLCSESARSITGASIPIDGGWTAR